ncbi:glycosyltransferase family 4 protein [Pleomorphovibrio marinus]|uniref:glycosyltransferase family 4 protein n=1 Tax=Pleomorphovibrio marinus TaxID=2164132 RepID=UPI000E0A6CE0|nr:glycosyltransferase family 1 protein [Pleomorphovibrio marinus]
MRIGIEAQRVFRKKKHGMDMVALQLIEHLQQIDRENQYFIFVNENEDPCISPKDNVTIVPLPNSPYPIWEQIHLSKATKKYELDLLHCTSNTAPIYLSCPLVLTLHDIIYLEGLNWKAGTWYQRFGNAYRKWNVPTVVNNAQKILTVSEFEQRRILAHFTNLPEEKVEVVHNGVNAHFAPVSEEDQERIRKKYALPEEFMLFLGNTDPKKNLKGVLEALAQLHHQGKLSLPIVMPDFGEEILSKMLGTLKAESLRSQIHLTGYIPNMELPAIYARAAFFLYPSIRESFGLPILEAMACGCPVITSTSSSMPEIAGDAALLVNPHSSEDLAKNILLLIENKAIRASLREKGFKRPPLFSYARGASKVLSIYEEICYVRK